MIRNSRNGKRRAKWQRELCNFSCRELRAAMMMPVMYEQLKREKLKIHRTRCVCARARATWEQRVGIKRYPDRVWELSGNLNFYSVKTCLSVIPMAQTCLLAIVSFTANLIFNIVL